MLIAALKKVTARMVMRRAKIRNGWRDHPVGVKKAGQAAKADDWSDGLSSEFVP